MIHELRASDFYESSWPSRDRARDDKCIAFLVYLDDAKISHSDYIASHPACHAHTQGYAASRAAAAADGARRALLVLLAMTSGAAVESVTLNNTLESFSF